MNLNDRFAACDQFICSECGIELQDWARIERDEDTGEVTHHEYEFKYCPNCGAKVRGGSMRLYERVTDDIANCTANCMVDCKRQPRYILDKTIPHSFMDFSDTCGEYEADGYEEGADDE